MQDKINPYKHKELETIYEDDGMLAINKPSGLLTIPDRFNAEAPNAMAILQKKYETLIPIHRLDRFTSGVVLFAKNAEIHREMSIKFEEREVTKNYLAIVDGRLDPPSGVIKAALAESMTIRGKMVINKRGKDSITEYKVVEQFNRFAFVSLHILTGRMHQIRVHMQHIGHPLVVDNLYGQREMLFLSEVKQKRFNIGKYEEERPIMARQPLHAHELTFVHPLTLHKTTCTAPLPKDMAALVRQLEKWDALRE
ncbi:MAG: RluA family pseudouridine synthase [Saprospiraceae bacterium]